MDSKITSSFIPRDTATSSPKRAPQLGGGFDLLMLGGVILFVSSVSLAVGVFLYMQLVESSLADKSEQLKRAQEAFEPALIAELTRLDDRITSSEDVLYQHLAPSELFRILEDLTLETISLRSLDFEARRGGDITIDIAGVARSVNSIALQADLYGKHTAITSPIFSNISRDENGVLFDVEASLNPTAFKYTNVLNLRLQPSTFQQEPLLQEETNNIPIFSP